MLLRVPELELNAKSEEASCAAFLQCSYTSIFQLSNLTVLVGYPDKMDNHMAVESEAERVSDLKSSRIITLILRLGM